MIGATNLFGVRLGSRPAHFTGAPVPENFAPVAVMDSHTMSRFGGTMAIDVLANDMDPDGDLLTITDAVAQFGVAVIGGDGTLQYTPPAGTETADLITYTIEDPSGLTDVSTVDVTIEDPELTLETLPSNEFTLTATLDVIDITVTEPGHFAGSYQVDLADIASGPVPIVAPLIDGTLVEGETLTAHALWIYDAQEGEPALTYQWLQSGIPIPGATAQSHVIAASDAGHSLSVEVTATGLIGSHSATAPAVQIPAAALPYAASLVYLAGDADQATGPVQSVVPVDEGTALVQSNTAQQPTAASGVLSFDGSDILVPQAQGSAAFADKATLPDGVAGGVAGEGFTITGLTRLSNGTWAAGNAGLGTQGSADAQTSSVVILSADFSTRIAEYLAADYDNSAETAVQGVTQDSDGYVWFVAKQLNKLICIDPTDGTEINQISLSFVPNGLTFDSLSNALVVQDETADTLRWIDLATKVEGQTIALPSGIDHLHFDDGFMTQGAVWMTYGVSGTEGGVRILDVETGTHQSHAGSFAGTNAIEGIFYDRANHRLYISDDAYFHNGTSGGNCVYSYDIAPPLEREFSIFFSGHVPSVGDTDCIIGYGRWESTVAQTGLYRPNGGNALRLIVERGGVSGPTDFTTADLTVDADYWVDVDMEQMTATLSINGVATETLPLGPAYTSWLSGGDGGPTVGGCVRLSNLSVNRTTTMHIRAAGIAFKAGQQAAVESTYQ